MAIGRRRIEGIAVDFPANKLKSGAGDSAIHILNSLADAALIHTGFAWKRMIPPKDDDDDDVHVDEDDDGSNDDEIVEEDDLIGDDDDDDAISIDLKAPTIITEEAPLQAMLHNTTDVIQWKQEVDRVAPLLKITIRQDAKDWRLHLEQMHTMQKTVEGQMKLIEPTLDQMSKEMSKTVERIASREKTLNNQLSSMMSKFRAAQDRRAELREKYKSASVGVSSRTDKLNQISEDIEQLKQQIEEQGAKSNDGAPLVKIKQAVNKMEEELQRMNVQIGTLEQSILNTYLRERFQFAADMYNAY
ncbi:unnamed protein product [Caenorhabditis bovis]|uniref:Intraflagellar transport protein 57 homolog n=1 Tax=Caenorhabditis bovis TaxID=2654633 RepID=A0A8S1FDZ9_9PELO|nr:unnamed protein product [Caenorhabditis bovis]